MLYQYIQLKGRAIIGYYCTKVTRCRYNRLICRDRYRYNNRTN